jgi:hypothetical protein
VRRVVDAGHCASVSVGPLARTVELPVFGSLLVEIWDA